MRRARKSRTACVTVRRLEWRQRRGEWKEALRARRGAGVGLFVDLVFFIDVVHRIRQVVHQFIAFYLVGEIQ
jgi:hypothetical protein